jgi:DNA-binding transcriptional MocR family regulator
MLDWAPKAKDTGKPQYLQLADAIERDVTSGTLRPGDRLPPQRLLAGRMGIDFTTVSRGYAEARARGLVDSHVGRGTFVAASSRSPEPPEYRRGDDRDLTMNLPPEPNEPELLAQMQDGLQTVSSNLIALLRYQSSTGGVVDREAASSWLSMRGMVPSLERIAITPGAHPTILSILLLLSKPGETILSESITYPGVRAIASRLGLRLIGVTEDVDGIVPEALEQAIQTHGPKALYLNPTLNNPTTRTIPLHRRQALADVLNANGLPLIEDDAYGFIPPHPPAPMATLAPELTWHIGGLAKCIGAGLRLAYTVAPNARSAIQLAQCLKTVSVMPSPLSMALATRWIQDGTADNIRRFIRKESGVRQEIARRAFERFDFDADPFAFNIWLRMPSGTNRAELIGLMSGTEIGVIPSDAFTVTGSPSEAVRICLGGKISRAELTDRLSHCAMVLEPDVWQG